MASYKASSTQAERKIRSLLNRADVNIAGSIHCYIPKGKTKYYVEIQVIGADLTFEYLCKISEVLKTKNIDIRAVHGSDGCPTCGHGTEDWVELDISDAEISED